MIRLDAKYAGFLLSFLITLGMSFVMSLAMTAFNTGLGPGFLIRWLAAWGISFSIALPAAAIIIPAAKNLTHKLLGLSDSEIGPDNGARERP